MSLENSAHSHICLQWCKTSPVSLHPTAGTAEGPGLRFPNADYMWMLDFAFGNVIYQEEHKKCPKELKKLEKLSQESSSTSRCSLECDQIAHG